MRRANNIEEARKAIREGRARMKTFSGDHKVVGILPIGMMYDIITNNSGEAQDRQSWTGSWHDIVITDSNSKTISHCFMKGK